MQRSFDPWQREAIEISGGRHLVLAPPGCGKTDILTERVVHAHECGVEYGDMLCLTFTNRAAKGMAQRIADRTGNPVPDELFVGNIHRYCSQMLFNEGVVSRNSAIIDEGDVDSIIQEDLCRKLEIKSRSTELMRCQHALWQLTLGMRGEVVLHNELLQSGAMHKLCDVLGMPATEDSLAHIYLHIEHLMEQHTVLHELAAANTMRLASAYQEYKAENDLLDYDDLLVMGYWCLVGSGQLAVDSGQWAVGSGQGAVDSGQGAVDSGQGAVGSEGTGGSSRSQVLPVPHSPQSIKRYRWIEVDEVQDLNALQLALIDQLAAPDATVVYLGDEQQAIFSFIGAKLETLEALKQRCRGNIHYLHTNYRSPKYLLDLQNDYAVKTLHIRPDLLPHTDNTIAARPEDMCLIDVGDATLESYYAARLAKRYGDMDGEGRVAILVSTNREADEVGEVMTGMGINHFKISGTDLFSLPSVRVLLAHLSVLTDETVFIDWARLLWGLRVVPTYTAARTLMRDMRRVALLPTDFLDYPGSSYIQAFIKAYEEEELVIFDTETTGLDPREDDIIQIAAIRVKRGRVVGEAFNIILETERELPATVGGKENPMIAVYRNSRKHRRAEGLRRFVDYCQGKTLVGHNVEYDYQILKNNLRRECEGIEIEELCPRHLDTLKYIRLVRPRLRHYKLGHLLEVLHLEGQNSHQADDDIMATLSLLTFCHLSALQKAQEQRHFLARYGKEAERFRARYEDIYRHATSEMYEEGSGIVEELSYGYQRLVAAGLIEPVEKWQHLQHYLETDLIRKELYPTLRTQLERYVTDMCTSKEADMCGSSLEERYIISTVHKAKGLEFDSVIVYRAIDGSYPGSQSWTEKQISEDARRLFVALSRSRKRLCIITDSYYGRTPHALSPFLEKVRGHFRSYHRTPDGKIREDFAV